MPAMPDDARATSLPGMDLEPVLAPAVEAGRCPHLAMLLASYEQVAPAVASFYGLGAKRNGWLLHRSLPGRGEDDRSALREAGLEVGELERADRLSIDELPLDVPPEAWAEPWLRVLDARLAKGFDAAWWSPFPIGPEPDPPKRRWPTTAPGRPASTVAPAVTLCLYVVGGVGEATGDGRFAALATVHDALLVPEGDGVALVEGRPA
jgi:hypothetical protein